MVPSVEQAPSFEETFARLNMEIDCVPPSDESDVYGGFFVVKASGEDAVSLLKVLVEESGYYEKGYPQESMQRQVEAFEKYGNLTDLAFRNPEGEIRMLRVQSAFSFDKDKDVELTFGGGSNQTTYEEMRYILAKSSETLLSKVS